MFNFKKIGKKVLSSVLGATLAIGGFLNTQIVKANGSAGYAINQENAADQAIEQSIDNFTSNEKVREIVKGFTADKYANFERFSSIGEVSEIGPYEDLECKIAMFLENETKKAIVGVSVSDSNGIEFSSYHMGEIIDELRKLGIKKVDKKDFKNVYLVIRSKEKGAEFYIGDDDIMRDFKNATAVVTSEATFNCCCVKISGGSTLTAPGATIGGFVGISENSTLDAPQAMFKYGVKISVGSKLTAPRATFDNLVKISGGSTLDAPGAKFKEGFLKCVKISGGSTLTARGAKFGSAVKISENSKLTVRGAMFKSVVEISGGSKLEAQGATFYHLVEISERSTLDAPQAMFKYGVKISVGSKLDALRATFDGCVEISGGGTLTARGATFKYGFFKWVKISGGVTLIAPGATFDDYVEISGGGTLIAPGAKFKFEVKISENSKLDAPGAMFRFEVKISENSKLDAPGATIGGPVTVNGNNLTVDISNAKFKYECYGCYINAQNSRRINLSGCDFDKIIFGGECSNLEITVNDDEVDKFCKKHKNLSAGVFASINGKSWEELKKKQEKELKKKQEERKRREVEERLKREKEEEKREKMKILKYAGVFGLIYIAFVTPIVFKDEIKSLFSSKKIAKTPACKVKTSAV